MIPIVIAVLIAIAFEVIALHSLDRAAIADARARSANVERVRAELTLDAAATYIANVKAELAHARSEWVLQFNRAEALARRWDKAHTCIVCEASLLENDEPPHCLDCHVDHDALCDWEEGQAS